jgi:hypothetical protein
MKTVKKRTNNVSSRRRNKKRNNKKDTRKKRQSLSKRKKTRLSRRRRVRGGMNGDNKPGAIKSSRPVKISSSSNPTPGDVKSTYKLTSNKEHRDKKMYLESLGFVQGGSPPLPSVLRSMSKMRFDEIKELNVAEIMNIYTKWRRFEANRRKELRSVKRGNKAYSPGFDEYSPGFDEIIPQSRVRVDKDTSNAAISAADAMTRQDEIDNAIQMEIDAEALRYSKNLENESYEHGIPAEDNLNDYFDSYREPTPTFPKEHLQGFTPIKEKDKKKNKEAESFDNLPGALMGTNLYGDVNEDVNVNVNINDDDLYNLLDMNDDDNK